MLVDPNLDVMLHDKERGLRNKFALVTLTLKRARQINDGSPILVETPAKKPVSIALHEIYQSKVRIRDKSDEPQATLSQEDAQAAALAAALGTPQLGG
ncbi:MAG: DNA-directed RNA polymerase subunit omega [Candidatus Eremiobacteraeota bacterium]|nr:DNA-directed RNA polymerase subunit omega [Candidatus Eremiobacteraeota bacterium]